MNALLQARVEPSIYLYDVTAQDRMRLALSGLYDQLHTVEDRWVDTAMAFFDDSTNPDLIAQMDVLDAEQAVLRRQIAELRATL